MYYVKINNRTVGPFSADRLKEMIREGKLKKEHSISPDKEQWKKAGDIEGLFGNPKRAPVSPKAVRNTTHHTVVGDDESENETQEDAPQVAREKLTLKGKAQPLAQQAEEATPQNMNADGTMLAAGKSQTSTSGGTNCLAVLWDPILTLPSIYKERGAQGSAQTGLLLMVLSVALSFAILYDAGVHLANLSSGETAEIFFRYFILACVPIFTLALAGTIVRYLFSDNSTGSFGGDLLISGGAYLSLNVGGLFIYFFSQNVLRDLSETEMVYSMFLIFAIFLYCVSCFILTLFSGTTRISNISERRIVFILPFMVLVSGVFTWGVYRLLMPALLK